MRDRRRRADDDRDAATRSRALPGVGDGRHGPYGPAGGAGSRSAQDGRTAYATVTFDHRADEIAAGAGPGRRRHRAGGRRRRAPGRAGRRRRRADRGARAPSWREIVGVAVAAVVLFLAFGSLAATLLPIATALVSVGTAYAGIALLGHVMTVADFAPMLGMLIGLGVGIDYALFIVTRHRKGLRARPARARRPPDAPSPRPGAPSSSPGATVCIALLGMLVLRLGFLNGVAIAASLTVVLTVAASVTLLPALLS